MTAHERFSRRLCCNVLVESLCVLFQEYAGGNEYSKCLGFVTDLFDLLEEGCQAINVKSAVVREQP